jgi:holo-[acyl-carrier protein] synthase
VIRIGTDICSLKRIEEAYARFGDKFLAKIFTAAEITFVLSEPPNTVTRIAGRFAAKEAVSKALGTGWRGANWKEVEILRAPSGEPLVTLSGRARAIADRRSLKNWQVSISHEREYAIAMVVAYPAGFGEIQ